MLGDLPQSCPMPTCNSQDIVGQPVLLTIACLDSVLFFSGPFAPMTLSTAASSLSADTAQWVCLSPSFLFSAQ